MGKLKKKSPQQKVTASKPSVAYETKLEDVKINFVSDKVERANEIVATLDLPVCNKS